MAPFEKETITHITREPTDRTFVGSYFVMHKAQIHHEQPGYVAVLNKKAPHPRNPRSSLRFDIADPNPSPLVKLIHLSHTTVRCHPSMQVLFAHRDTSTASDRIHKERNRKGPETRYPESRFPKRPYFAV